VKTINQMNGPEAYLLNEQLRNVLSLLNKLEGQQSRKGIIDPEVRSEKGRILGKMSKCRARMKHVGYNVNPLMGSLKRFAKALDEYSLNVDLMLANVRDRSMHRV
jgi:hypothetical protein